MSSGRLVARLSALGQHPLLAGRLGPGADRAAVEAAYAIPASKATELARAAATTVFAGTAISQNGRLMR